MAAIVHDIACLLCRKKYRNTNGQHQEDENEALLYPFLSEFKLPGGTQERIVFLVTHQHSFYGIKRIDYQILVEADFLVNATEENIDIDSIRNFKNKIIKIHTGMKLFDSIYPLLNSNSSGFKIG